MKLRNAYRIVLITAFTYLLQLQCLFTLKLFNKNDLGGCICFTDLGSLWNIYDCHSPPSHNTKSINVHTTHFILLTLNGTFLHMDIAPHLLCISIPRSSLDNLTLVSLASSNPLISPS